MKYYKTLGFILRKKPFGEKDHLLTVLTPNDGKMEIIAKGTQNIKSRRLSALEIPNLVSLEIHENHQKKFLSKCELQNSFAKLKKSLKDIAYLHYLVELTDRFSPLEKSEYGKFSLLQNTLSRLNEHPNPTLLIEHFCLKLLTGSGCVPDFKVCGVCGQKIQTETAYLSQIHLQLYCLNCYRQKEQKEQFITLHLNNLKLLSFLRKTPDYHLLSRLKISNGDFSTLNQVTSLFVNHHLPFPLNSVNFLNNCLK